MKRYVFQIVDQHEFTVTQFLTKVILYNPFRSSSLRSYSANFEPQFHTRVKLHFITGNHRVISH